MEDKYSLNELYEYVKMVKEAPILTEIVVSKTFLPEIIDKFEKLEVESRYGTGFSYMHGGIPVTISENVDAYELIYTQGENKFKIDRYGRKVELDNDHNVFL